MKRSLLGTGILTVALLTGSAFADHGRGHGRDRDDRREHARQIGDHDRRPPGWDHGQKRGWGDHNVPPGQARKQAIERHAPRGERARREQAIRERREARERRMRDWRERERRERERRAEWRRRHPHAATTNPSIHPMPPVAPSGQVTTIRPPVPRPTIERPGPMPVTPRD